MTSLLQKELAIDVKAHLNNSHDNDHEKEDHLLHKSVFSSNGQDTLAVNSCGDL